MQHLNRLLPLCLVFAACSCAEPEYTLALSHPVNDEVTVEVHAGMPSPTWFGPHPIQIHLILADVRHVVIEDRLHNDGARLRLANFPMRIHNEALLICLRGEEQEDVLYSIKLATPREWTKEEKQCVKVENIQPAHEPRRG